MKASIIKIGNSKGIRIPKTVFAQCGFLDEVELEVRNNQLIVSAPEKARLGWSLAFKSMHEHQDDTLINGETSSWDESEWEWK